MTLPPINRREFSQISLLAPALALTRGPRNRAFSQEREPKQDSGPSTRSFAFSGIYFHDGFEASPRRMAPLHWSIGQWRKQVKWLAACGIGGIEFATQMEFSRVPETDLEKKKIADRLQVMDIAHDHGMRFGYILGNTVVSTVPPGEDPGGQQGGRAKVLCPREPGNFDRTVALQSWYLDTYKEADFFEEFAADWGGCTCGQCNYSHFLDYVRVLAEQLKTTNSQARLFANTWAIAWWGEDPLVEGWRRVWDLEIEGSRRVIAALPDLPPNTHLALPCSHLYRPLTFASYGSPRATPSFPEEHDVRAVREADRTILAWPHFVMDDDIYRPAAWGVIHSEVRYLTALMKTLIALGIDRIMGNLYLPTLQLSNTFALGCLSKDPYRDPATILGDFARVMAHPDDVASLTDVLIWLDNNSYWEEQLRQQKVADGFEPHFPCSLNRDGAAKVLSAVRPRTSAELPLPVSTELWLDDLRRSVERMSWAG